MKLTKLFKKYIINKAINSKDEDNLLKPTFAKQILEAETYLNMTKDDVATLLKIPVAKLLLMENADLSINVKDYSNVATNLIDIAMHKVIDEANRSTVVK